MTTIQSICEELSEKMTDYGYNSEYGYRNDWKEGADEIIRPFREKLLSILDEVVMEARTKKRLKGIDGVTDETHDAGWNCCRAELLSRIDKIKGI